MFAQAVDEWSSSHTKSFTARQPEHFRGVWSPLALQDITPALELR